MRHTLRTALAYVFVGFTFCVFLQIFAGAAEATASADGSSGVLSFALADATPTVPPNRMEEDRSAMRFTGKWKFVNHAGSSGFSKRYSRTPKASASMAFTGTGVSIIGQVGPNRGRARIYLDGVAMRVVSFYSPTYKNQQPVFRVSGLEPGKHTLKVVVLGSRATSSTGDWIHLDAFDIEGGKVASLGDMPGARVQNGDKRLYRKGSWSTVKNTGAYRGTLARTTTRGSAVTVRFKGTDIIWFGRKGTAGGKAEVWLDGKKVAVVSQYTTGTAVDRRVAWAATGLKNTTHDVVIKSLGQASAAGGGKRTDYDAFQIRGEVLTALRPTPFKYPWKTYIVIDKSSYKLYWVKNKMLVKTYSIAHGRNNNTPERVWRIDAKYKTDPSSVYGPRKMRMFKRVKTSSGYRYVFTAYAIHGTNEEWVIGTQASAGCIRMYNKDVRELFPQVPMGTMVITRK